ncbi:hypothetical protein SNEBB_008976 [Seison nebaliae]|nr:hypothetical protein SNEBB_008976 [Seison nebaliae]
MVLNLDPRFPVLLMKEKWKILNDLANGRDKIYIGLYNGQKIGVCLTNVIIAMISASPILMNVINSNTQCKSFDVCNFMKKITSELHKDNPMKDEVNKISVSDVLAAGIQHISDNRPYKADYGVSGSYLLYKKYSNEKDLKTVDSESSDKKLHRLIFSSKDCSGRDFMRWNNIVRDLFLLDSTLQQRDWYDFFWYEEIKMLNLEMKIGSYPRNSFYKPRPFLKDYYTEFDEQQIQLLRNDLVRIHPKVVQISSLELLKYDIHPETITNFVRALTYGYRLVNVLQMPFTTPDFHVVITRQHPTVPKIKNKEKYFVELPIANIKYHIKAISIRIENEIQYLFSHLGQPTIEPSAETTNCINYHLNGTYVSIGESIPDAINFMKQREQIIRQRLGIMCSWVNSKAATRLLIGIEQGTHAITLIEKDNQWTLINDEYSIRIDDIEQMTDILYLEKVSGYLLEEYRDDIVTTLADQLTTTVTIQ